MTDAEWFMIENKGNPEFCEYTIEEVMSPPVMPAVTATNVRERFANRSDVRFQYTEEEAKAKVLAVLANVKKAQ